jgi:glycosyltransferase involved in cell wall biosynthesis
LNGESNISGWIGNSNNQNIIIKKTLMDNLNKKPLVSIVISAHNEAAILEENLCKICDYMASLENSYCWELIVVNDGSKDDTGKIADTFAKGKENIKILHNKKNLYLGNSLRRAFQVCHGEYILTMDIDLSYSTDHIEKLLRAIIESQADVAIASPYMKGGKITNVPFKRKWMSKIVNKFLSLLSYEKIYTFTGMVRAYNTRFLKNLSIKAQDFEINPEIIYKTLLLRGRIVEIPAHLDWSYKKDASEKRKSKIRFSRGILSGLMSGFIFRPYIFFMSIGFLLFLLSLYIIIWLVIDIFSIYTTANYIDNGLSTAIGEIFRRKPHAFIIGGISLIISFQFLNLGFLSLQSKRYFEELFHLNTTILKKIQDKLNNNS